LTPSGHLQSVVHDPRRLVVHVVYRFDVGGLENGVVNLINHMPEDAFRHAVVSLTDVTAFRARVQRPDVEFYALNKPPGHGFRVFPQLYRLFRSMRPAIVHTRNLAPLEAMLPAWAARVAVRIHGEHGRDVDDLAGTRRSYQWIRRFYSLFVTRFVALSKDLETYLAVSVGIQRGRIVQIYNGVDTAKFQPRVAGTGALAGCPFDAAGHWVIGTVGRMQKVKDQITLAKAFIQAMQLRPALRRHVRLAMIGDGPLRAEAQALIDRAGLADLCWLPGERSDVPDVMRSFSCFVLPSLAEGISNTILEAMATGLPVVATDVGGNAELVSRGVTGEIVPADDADAMCQALIRLAEDSAKAAEMGRAGRAEAERRFSLQAMVSSYRSLYEQLAGPAGINVVREG